MQEDLLLVGKMVRRIIIRIEFGQFTRVKTRAKKKISAKKTVGFKVKYSKHRKEAIKL